MLNITISVVIYLNKIHHRKQNKIMLTAQLLEVLLEIYFGQTPFLSEKNIFFLVDSINQSMH